PTDRAAAEARSESTFHTTTSRPRATNVRATARPFTPAPITAAGLPPARPSVSAASPAAAPVRTAVTAAAYSTAPRIPFDAYDQTTSPATVGSPSAGFPGNDVTHFK